MRQNAEVPVQLLPSVFDDVVPTLLADHAPPDIHGMADLAHRAYDGVSLADLLTLVARPVRSEAMEAALAFDQSLAHRLHFQVAAADALQAFALAQCGIYRVKPGPDGVMSARRLRVLALVAPGDLMVNTPLEFITRYLDVRLDLMFVQPGRPLPRCVPDHDVAFFAVSEADAATLRRLAPLFDAWPRPVLNDPAAIERLSRDVVSRGLAACGALRSPVTSRMARAGLNASVVARPMLIRPVGTHAGVGLDRIETPADLENYLLITDAAEFFVTEFVDYRGRDGLFRKYRIAFVDGAPFLCHMAVSTHWMVHYLNAEMAENAERRADEHCAMLEFDTGFAERHAVAFAQLNEWMGLNYYQIDCAETSDGRLLVFEADVAAIIHLMDPPGMFPYKPPQMRRVFAAFGDMLDRAKAARYQMSFNAMAERPVLVRA